MNLGFSWFFGFSRPFLEVMNTFETSWPEKFVSLLLLFLLLAQFLFFLHIMDVVMFLAAW